MSDDERSAAIKEETQKIEDENSENGKYVVSVRSFFQGNESVSYTHLRAHET